MFRISNKITLATTFLLAFSIIFTPFSYELYAQSEYPSATINKAEFQAIYDKVMALEEIKISSKQSFFLNASSNLHNVGEAAKQTASNITGTASSIVGKDTQKYEAQYVNYVKTIKEANAEIKKAKKQAQQIKKLLDKGEIEKAQQLQDNSNLDDIGIGSISNPQIIHQESLVSAGNDMAQLGSLTEALGSTLSNVSLLLYGASALALASTALSPASPVLLEAATAVDKISTGMDFTGSLVQAGGTSIAEAAQTGKTSDTAIFGSMAKGMATQGTKKIFTLIVGKAIDKYAGQLLAKAANTKYGKIAKNLFSSVETQAKNYLSSTFPVKKAYELMVSSPNITDEALEKVIKAKEEQLIEGTITDGAKSAIKDTALSIAKKTPQKLISKFTGNNKTLTAQYGTENISSSQNTPVSSHSGAVTSSGQTIPPSANKKPSADYNITDIDYLINKH